MDEKEYLVTCKAGHKQKMSADEISEVIEYPHCQKRNCDAEIIDVEPKEIKLECVECGWEESSLWNEAYYWEECPRCRSNTDTCGDIQVVGTRSHSVKEYLNFAPHTDSRPYIRKDRPDYWEVVIHYTSEDYFLKIMKEQKIKASSTGYFGLPAVCLTEAPIKFNKEFKKRYGEYGIAFKKSDIIRSGGGPAVYLIDSVISSQNTNHGFDDSLKPFVNVIRIPTTAPIHKSQKRVDYLHDREWRYPSDIDFTAVPPIGLIIPRNSAKRIFYGPDGDKLVSLAWDIKEIY